MASRQRSAPAKAERALSLARTPQEAKAVHDLAAAAKKYAKARGEALARQNQAARIQVLAAHKAGGFLAQLPTAPEGAAGHRGRANSPRLVSFQDCGLSQQAGDRWVKLAALEVATIEQLVAAATDRGEEFTFWAAYRELGREGARRKARVPPAEGTYATVVIDPPWPIAKIEREERPAQAGLDYPSLTVEELASLGWHGGALPLAQDAHVYLWVTHKYLPAGLTCFEAWEVGYQCTLTWVKNVGFTPFSWMYSTEHVLFGRVGSLELERKGLRLDFSGKVREHSRKPAEFYDLVRRASPAPRIDMFAREVHDGFIPWGDEAQGRRS